MVSFKYQALAIRKRVCWEKKKNLSIPFPFVEGTPGTLLSSSRFPLPIRALASGAGFRGRYGSPGGGTVTAVTRMEDPRTSERHSQSYDPGGGKHGKCESLPRSISPGLCQVYLPPSLSSQPRPKKEGVEVGSGQTLQGWPQPARRD